MSEFLDLFGRTSKAVRALADRDMRRHGLHLGQNHVLAALWEQDGRTPGEMAAALNVTTPTIVKMATRMAAAGLLERRRDDRDNRLVRLWLTDHGRDLRDPIERDRHALAADVTATLTATERRHLITALAKINQAALDLLGEPLSPSESVPD
ncbi:MarR family winged helix-turn-helix transcriptional regulator [Nocardia yamanashiensis]|uniref:MarR family winged helix-turn-helix transcriptional regulator n=1 Tax=Nocardia yamanashiensis TaxID=209247 RepID=UPI001E3E2604|nr:MarR family winged helix-turn-helix transcriptional regulator [Nocardia yamanashiensis]UGT40985.1 MarR family winged helix-turn-helix transcriptional regulator [Nocardia yamanashiensis]